MLYCCVLNRQITMSWLGFLWFPCIKTWFLIQGDRKGHEPEVLIFLSSFEKVKGIVIVLLIWHTIPPWEFPSMSPVCCSTIKRCWNWWVYHRDWELGFLDATYFLVVMPWPVFGELSIFGVFNLTVLLLLPTGKGSSARSSWYLEIGYSEGGIWTLY